jgi:hypothetical protein
LSETHRKSGPVRSTGKRRGCLNAAQIQLFQGLNDR